VPETAVTYAVSEQGVRTLHREREASLSAGLDVEWLEGPSTGELDLPFEVRAALRLEGQYKLHPLLLLGELARRLRGGGVPIITGCRMTAVDVEDHSVVVRTRRGDVHCSTLVLATGASVLDRGLLFAKLVPSRSFASAYRLPPGTKAPTGMFLSVDDPSRSLRCDMIDGAPTLIVGGGAHPTGRAESTGPLRDELDEWTTAHWPGAQRRTWWAAQDYRSVTHLPFAGMLPRSGGRVFAATGYDKWGMTNAVASALRIAGRLHGEPPTWGVALDEHHASLRDVGETVQANASVGGHLVADWVRSGITATPPEPPAEGAGRVVRRGMSPVAESTVGGVTRCRSAVCTHLGGILTWNDAECSWDCPLHGSRFTPDGEVLEGPAVVPLAAVEG
jgi:glycine/D-amino acid oxidase-like deaminating enzyme/nitrite reductase/ring-hydroxylating ferredoxin subunit